MLIYRQLLFILLIVFVDFVLYFLFRHFTILKIHRINFKKYYFGFTAINVLYILMIIFFSPENWPKNIYLIFTSFFFITTITKLTSLLLVILPFLAIKFQQIKRLKQAYLQKVEHRQNTLHRRAFIGKMVLGLSSIPAIGLLYGIVKTAYQVEIEKLKLNISKIKGSSFNIVQISDMHCGSYFGSQHLADTVSKINALQPDIVFFTGDLVNYKTEECYPFIDELKKLEAKVGIYAVLGNHDFGDYMNWKTEEDKKENVFKMEHVFASLGWNLLRNSSKVVEVKGNKINVIGVDNISAAGFKTYGSLKNATDNIDTTLPSFLLSHDPTHWDMEVNSQYNFIDCMFSGHTHGGQVGVYHKDFQWSPAKLIFKQWAGLYQKENQYLYVNRGLGTIGYNGRLGILPEITLFEISAT